MPSASLEPAVAPRLGENLGVLLGLAEGTEGSGDAVDADLTRDQRRRIDPPRSQMAEGGGELFRGVAENELQVQFLVDAEGGLEVIGLHAHADDDHARLARRPLENLLQHTGNADAFE